MKKHNVYITIAFIVVAVLLGYLLISYQQKWWPYSKMSDNTPSKIEAETDPKSTPLIEDQKTSASSRVKEQVAEEATAKTALPTSSIPVTITTVQPGNTVYVRVLINELVSQSASCTLDMKGPSNKAYSASSPTQPLAGSSTCQGFNIQQTSLAPGNWKITITVKDGARSGSSTVDKSL